MMKGLISAVAIASVAFVAESVEYASQLKGALASTAHHTFRMAQLEVAVDSKGPMDQIGTLCYQQLREITEEVSNLDKTHQKFSTDCQTSITGYKTQINRLEKIIARADARAGRLAVRWNRQRPKIPRQKKKRERYLRLIHIYEARLKKQAAARARDKATYDQDMIDFSKALGDIDMLKKILKNSTVSNGETSGNVASQGFIEAFSGVSSDRMRLQSNRISRAAALLDEDEEDESSGPSGVDKIMNLLLKIRDELFAEMDKLTKTENDAISQWKKLLLRSRARINAFHMARARAYMRVGDILTVIGKLMVREAGQRQLSAKKVKKIDHVTIDKEFMESECAAEPPLYTKSRATKLAEIKTINLMLKILKNLNWSGAVYSAIARISVGGIDENPEPGFDLVSQMGVHTAYQRGVGLNTYNMNDKDYTGFGRVAVKLQIGASWVWASFDAWKGSTVTDYLMPTLSNKRVQDKRIKNLVIHKSPSAKVQTGSQAEGNVEMWATNYRKQARLENGKKVVPGASDGTYDFGDERNGGGTHGCFQIHDFLGKQTLLAVNNMNHQGKHDVGIGNRPIGSDKKMVNPDWTFAKNSGKYAKQNVAVTISWFFQPKDYGKNDKKN